MPQQQQPRSRPARRASAQHDVLKPPGLHPGLQLQFYIESKLFLMTSFCPRTFGPLERLRCTRPSTPQEEDEDARGPHLLHQIEAWVGCAASGHRSQPRTRPTHRARGISPLSGTRQHDDRCRRERGAAAVLIAPRARGAIQRSSARRCSPRPPEAAAGLGCSRTHLLHFCLRSRVLSAIQVLRSFLFRRRAGSRASRRGKGAGRDCARARRKSEEGGGSGVLGVAGTAPANDEPSSKVSVCRSRQGAIAGTRTSRSSTCRTPGAHLTRERDGPLCSLSLCGSVALVACRRRRPRRPRAQRPTGAGAVRASAVTLRSRCRPRRTR